MSEEHLHIVVALKEVRHFPFTELGVAMAALEQGGSMPTVLNAANEIAVEAFLHGRIRFDQIHAVNLATLEAVTPSKPQSLSDLLELDRQSRQAARAAMTRLA